MSDPEGQTSLIGSVNPEAGSAPKGSGSSETVKSSKAASKADTTKEEEVFCVHLTSNTLFLFGFYVALAALDLSWEKESETIPDFVLEADDDTVWLLYPEVGDDYVGEGRFFPISKEQIVYFFGALAFVLEGFWDFFSYPGMRGFAFILAGSFGMVSCWLQERDEFMSYIFNSLSAHLYALEAIGLLLNRHTHYHLKYVIMTADVFFLISTCIDTALSYCYIFDIYNVALARLDVASACIWLTCAVIYVAVTLRAKRKGFFEPQELAKIEAEEDSSSSSSDDGSAKEVVANEEEKAAPNDAAGSPEEIEITPDSPPV